MKRGDTFTHAHWLDERNAPARCVVTRVADGCIYYRIVYADGVKGKPAYFPEIDAQKYIKK